MTGIFMTALIKKRNTDAHGGLPVIVVDEILAVTREDLDVPVHRSGNRKRPVELCPAVGARARPQRVAPRQRQHMAAGAVHHPELAAPSEVLDVRVVVALTAPREHARPRAHVKGPRTVFGGSLAD